MGLKIMESRFSQHRSDPSLSAIASFSIDYSYEPLAKLILSAKDEKDEELYRNLLIAKMLSSIDPNMEALLGDKYYQGLGVTKDVDKATLLFQHAETRGSIRARYDLGWLYYDKGDFRRAIDEFTFCIGHQDFFDEWKVSQSYSSLGDSYSKIPDPQWYQAVEYLSIAADKYKHPFACRRLGQIYSDESTKIKDIRKAIAYYELGASLGDKVCVHELAQTYMFGESEIGRRIDFQRAEQLLLPYQYDNPPDINILDALAYIYMNGDSSKGVLRDLERAKAFFERSWHVCQTAYVAANLGYTYYCLDEYTNAEKMLLFASQQGNTSFSDFLGRIYKNGYVGEPDIYKARRYYEESFRRGSINNVFCLIEYIDVLIELGEYNEAFDASTKGLQDYNDVQFEFIRAKLVLEGKVYKMDLSEAAELMEDVCTYSGYEDDGHTILGDYYSNKRQYMRAIRHYTASFEKGNVDAAVMIGRLYERGDGSLGLDQDTAYSWYLKAANAGSELGKQEVQCFRAGFFGGYKRYRSL